jgi:HAE1 family hydrophobic/amphiphilic exporter-1
MSFSDNFIKKPIMTTLLAAVILIFGAAAFFKLPISDLPVVDLPVIVVSVAYPGASPNTMASTVASPLESQFMQIPGLQSVISNNTEGQTQIILTFDLNRNVDLAAPDVQAAISRAMGNLPTDLPAPPVYQKTNPTDMPIMYLTVTSSTLTPGQLYDYANRTIGQRISMIEGVSQVQVWGAKSAVRVQADPKKIASMQIGIDDIAGVLQQGTVTIPGGSIDGPHRAFAIEPHGQLLSASEYEGLIVAYRNGSPVRLKDIAACVDSTDNDVMRVMTGNAGEPLRAGTVVIAVSRQAGTNTVALASRVAETVEALKSEMPGSVRLDIFYDKSHSIIESINDVKMTILIAIMLVVLSIYLFLGRLSDTVIPSVTIPFTLVGTFIVMKALGYSLDNLSLMGIILAVGFIVDDAIVVLENTVRLIESGKSPVQAAIESARQITFTIISMTLSLAVIFIPLIFMGGVVGRIFREFAVTVVITIVVSGVISLTLSPMMCARMLSAAKKGDKTALQKFMDGLMAAVIAGYGRALKKVLDRPFVTWMMWGACLGGTLLFFTVLPKTFLPEGDSGALFGTVLSPLGTSSEQARMFQDEINEIIRNDPNVERLLSITGEYPGADQSGGMFVIVLKEQGERLPMQKFVERLRGSLAHIPYGFCFLKPIPALGISTGGESTAQGNKYSYKIKGADQAKVYACALELEKAMRGLPGYVEVQNSVRLDLPQINVKLLRDRASTLGITAGDIEKALGLGYAGGKVTMYKTDIDQYNVIVEVDKKYQRVPEDVSQLYVRSPLTNKLVPIGSVAELILTVGPQNVPHSEQLNAATVSFNLKADMPLGVATKNLEAAAEKILPPGLIGSLQGEAEEFQEAVKSLGILLIVAVFLKYVIMGILYESYVHPFTILTTLPVATLGGLATLWIFGQDLSLYAYIGIFMLLGIVAKNGIMMVDFANENLAKGATNYNAIYEASIVRFRPILLTGVSTILGALPIALGYGADGSSRMPLGLIIVGGLIFSQVVTLFVTPGIFLHMQAFQEKYLNRWELTREGAARREEFSEK